MWKKSNLVVGNSNKYKSQKQDETIGSPHVVLGMCFRSFLGMLVEPILKYYWREKQCIAFWPRIKMTCTHIFEYDGCKFWLERPQANDEEWNWKRLFKIRWKDGLEIHIKACQVTSLETKRKTPDVSRYLGKKRWTLKFLNLGWEYFSKKTH